MSHKQDLMKGTLFQQVTQHYTLKLPSKKSLSKKIIPKLEALALSFYSHVFEKIIQTDYKNTILQNYLATTQPIREAYTNFFYSLSTKSQKNLDFIACLICLLSQIIISGQKLQSDKKIQQFIDSLNKNQQKLRDYMYVLYTYETLACRVNNQSAKFIFNKYIVCQNNANETNIGTKLKLNIQLKKIKENLQINNQYVFIRHRIRKIGRQRNFEQELKSLMEQNRIQLQQQSKKNVKFHKYINKCMTQGTIEFNPELVKKSSKVIKISSFLRTIKNLEALTKSRKRERQKKNQSYNQKGSKYWSSVVKNIKDAQFLSKRQRIQALYSVNSGQISNNSQVTPIQPQDKFIPRNQNLRPEGVIHKIQRSMNHKRTKLQFNNILPDIKQFKEFITPLDQEITFSPSPIKSIHFNSRRLKKQLQDFLNEQNTKKY